MNQVKSTATLIQMSGVSESYIYLVNMNKQLEIEKLCIRKYDEMVMHKSILENINISIDKL